MSRTAGFVAVLTMGLWTLAGCATARSYQSDIDALNSRIAALEGRISEKDAEIAGLRSRMQGSEAALAQAQNDKKMLSEKLEAALLKSPPPSVSAQDSDLK